MTSDRPGESAGAPSVWALLGEAMRASVGAVVAVAVIVGLLAVLLTSWDSIRYAPHAREQARLANDDPLWRTIPPSMTEKGRDTVLADAPWLPWSDAPTSASAYYTSDLPPDAIVQEWEHAAVAAGWRVAGRICAVGQATLYFTRRLGRWPATLEVQYPEDGGQFLHVQIAVPQAPEGPRPGGRSSGPLDPNADISECR